MGSRRTNPVVGLDYNFVSSLFLDAANSLQFFRAWEYLLSLSLLYLHASLLFFLFSRPLHFYSNFTNKFV